MTELLSSPDVRGDAELIALVRGGDNDAFGELYARHVEAARRLSRQLLRGSDADDLVSEAFTKVMTLLQAGHGPDVAFRAYLLTAIRRLHVDRVRGEARLTTSDDMSAFDPGIPFHDTAVDEFESSAAARAFASLPERWQLVLWHLEVEGQKPADIAPLLGMSPNSVSALAYRAREGLRQAFLSAHLRETHETTCRWVTEHLGSYVRKGLSRRDNAKIDAHLRECRTCSAMFLELAEVNSDLRAVIAPLLLGGLAAGYLAGAGGSGAGAGGLSVLWGRTKDVVGANTGSTAVAGAAAATVAAVAIAATVLGPAERADVAGRADEDPSQSSPLQPALGGERLDTPRGPGGFPIQASRRGAAPGPAAVLPPGTVDGAPEGPAPSVDGPAALLVEDVENTGDVAVGPGGPALPGGPVPGQPGTTMTIANASMDDEALRLLLAGVPDDTTDVVVRMSSRSGLVGFGQGGDCVVDPEDVATCPVGEATAARVGSPGMTSLVRTVRDLQSLSIPIQYPATLTEDTVTVSIRLPGAAIDHVDDSRTFTFRPSGAGTPTATTTATATSEPTEPTEPTEPSSTATSTATSEPTEPSSTATSTATSEPTEPTSTATSSPTETPGSGYDISMGLSLQTGPTSVRVTVDGLPVGRDRRDLVLDVAGLGAVSLVPRTGGCELTGGNRVVCQTSGLRHHVDLTLDVSRLGPGDTAALVFTASLAGADDPDTSNNSAGLTVHGDGGLAVEGLLGFGQVVVEAVTAVQRTVAAEPRQLALPVQRIGPFARRPAQTPRPSAPAATRSASPDVPSPSPTGPAQGPTRQQPEGPTASPRPTPRAGEHQRTTVSRTPSPRSAPTAAGPTGRPTSPAPVGPTRGDRRDADEAPGHRRTPGGDARPGARADRDIGKDDRRSDRRRRSDGADQRGDGPRRGGAPGASRQRNGGHGRR